jgi:recombinational DNA repair protein RecT
MTNEEIDVLLKNIDITKLTDRDSQEVVGYFDVLDLISESYENITITENNIVVSYLFRIFAAQIVSIIL